jgi:hypothetical protein
LAPRRVRRRFAENYATSAPWLRAARQTKVERVTASRDLAGLEALGVIEKDPAVGGRSTRYRVRLGKEFPVLLVK